jgi:hypothetical protein
MPATRAINAKAAIPNFNFILIASIPPPQPDIYFFIWRHPGGPFAFATSFGPLCFCNDFNLTELPFYPSG